MFIRRKGVKPMRKSFINKTDAKKWATAVERKLDTGDYFNYEEASKLLLADLLKRYLSEKKHKKMKSWKMYEYRIRILLQDAITDVNLLRISSKHLAEFRDRKLKEVGPATFNKYLSLTDDGLKAIYHSTDTVCFYIFQTREKRNEFMERTQGMKKAEREELYKDYS